MSQVAAKHTFLESRIEFGNFVCCNCSVACTVMFIFFVTFIFAADKIIRCYLQIPEKSFPSLREQQYFVAVSCQSNIEKMCSVLYCYNVPTEMTLVINDPNESSDQCVCPGNGQLCLRNEVLNVTISITAIT